MNWTKFFRHYLLALLVFNLTACATYQSVDVKAAMNGSLLRGVTHGDLVKVNTLDGESAKFRVTMVNADGVGGSEHFYRYEEMASLSVERPADNSNVSSIVLGVLAVAALVFLVSEADSVKVCSPSPCDPP